jgi:hypothetical protein
MCLRNLPSHLKLQSAAVLRMLARFCSPALVFVGIVLSRCRRVSLAPRCSSRSINLSELPHRQSSGINESFRHVLGHIWGKGHAHKTIQRVPPRHQIPLGSILHQDLLIHHEEQACGMGGGDAVVIGAIVAHAVCHNVRAWYRIVHQRMPEHGERLWIARSPNGPLCDHW